MSRSLRLPNFRPRLRRPRRAHGRRAGTLAGLLVALSVAPGVAPGHAAAQTPDVTGALAGLDEANGSAWVRPLGDALAPALTAGFFTSGGRGASIRLSVRSHLAFPASADATFDPVLPARTAFDGVRYDDPWVVASGGPSPTVSGSGEGSVLIPRPGSDFEAALDDAGVPPEARTVRLPGGAGLDRVVLPMVEASLALRGLGVRLTGRFSPTVELHDAVGDVSSFGGGVLVTVSRFLPLDAVDVGVSATTQKLRAADWLDASASAFGVVVSRQIGPVRPYLHGTLASATLDVRWRVRNPAGSPFLPADDTVVRTRREFDGEVRGAVGAAFEVGGLEASAEYQTGDRPVASLRVTLLRR